MFCQKCGQKLDDGALFCGNCGAPQNAPTPPQPTPSTPPPQNQQMIQQNNTAQGQSFQNSTNNNQEEMSKFQQVIRSGVVIYPMLFFLPFLGIPYMWFFNKTYSTKKKLILTGVFGLWLLFLAKSPSSKDQDKTPPAAQTQQTQQAQQGQDNQKNAAPGAAPRKNFGKMIDFWRAYNAEMKNTANGEPPTYKLSYDDSSVGYLSAIDEKKGNAIKISLETKFMSDNVDEIRVDIFNDYILSDKMYGLFMVGCAKAIDATSQDLSIDERNELLKKLHIVTANRGKAGRWRQTHNDLEYILESNTDSSLGMTFTVKIRKN